MEETNQQTRRRGPVEVDGKLYWPTYTEACAHAEYRDDKKVIRWISRPGRYETLFT